MNNNPMKTHEPHKDLVLLGGGHTHVLALKKLAMNLPPGLRVTLVSESDHAPYSGMLPGLVAGHYRHGETHIDLRLLCASLGIRFVKATGTGIDPVGKTLALAGRPALGFDYLSINVGAQPALDLVPGAADHAIAVKPVASFYRRWLGLLDSLQRVGSPERVDSLERVDGDSLEQPDNNRPCRLLVVGGGAGGVEMTLAIAFRLASHAVAIQLLCGGELLEQHNRRARAAVRKSLQDMGVDVIENDPVTKVEQGFASTASGRQLPWDELLWCTAAAAPDWLADTGLPRNEQGFLLTDDTLQVQGFPHIFAVGDAAVQVRHPRPRAGVYAVRQGPVLADNMLRLVRGKPLLQHTPQRRFLSLLSLGSRNAVASRGLFCASGAWVWRWKNRIDRRFMEQFPTMDTNDADAAMSASAQMPMHCGGCGAKLPAGLLRDTLGDLAHTFPQTVNPDCFNDDAALLNMDTATGQSPTSHSRNNATELDDEKGELLVQTADTLRDFLDDPWLMGRVTALHALSDIYAMGAAPRSCLAHVCLPHGGAGPQSRDLLQLMSGAMLEMDRAGCSLVGGHSIEGAELSAGFTINGQVSGERLLTKDGIRERCVLVLTKPLGTGVVFAAHAQARVPGRTVSAAIESMLCSNGAAASVALESGAVACTDITGFGLAGHLLEMLARQPKLQARLQLQSIPLLDGAEALLRRGFASTLSPGNQAAAAPEMDIADDCKNHLVQALYDPQTSGGLLIAVVADRAETMLAALKEQGCSKARIIGEICTRPVGESQIQVDSHGVFLQNTL